MKNPLARKNGLYMEQVADEVILYDKATHKAHCLNKTAAMVWEHADGSRTLDDLAGILEAKMNIPKDQDIVLLSLQQLEAAGLMQEGTTADCARPSRRQLGRKLAMAGLSASVVPVIASVLAPTPAMASSPGTTVTLQKYLQDLNTVQTDISKNPFAYLHSPVAQTDYASGQAAGTQGVILQTLGNKSGAENDFLVAQNDFDGVLKALGLPPL